MKKENKKMAQERRAAERKKEATMRLVRNTLIIALIVAFFVGMIVYGVIDSRKQKGSGGRGCPAAGDRYVQPGVHHTGFFRYDERDIADRYQSGSKGRRYGQYRLFRQY